MTPKRSISLPVQVSQEFSLCPSNKKKRLWILQRITPVCLSHVLNYQSRGWKLFLLCTELSGHPQGPWRTFCWHTYPFYVALLAGSLVNAVASWQESHGFKDLSAFPPVTHHHHHHVRYLDQVGKRQKPCIKSRQTAQCVRERFGNPGVAVWRLEFSFKVATSR